MPRHDLDIPAPFTREPGGGPLQSNLNTRLHLKNASTGASPGGA